MEIVIHGHHAVISPHMQRRAERQVRRLARRLPRAVRSVVRFEQDGAFRRVEVELHAPRRRPLVAQGIARHYGPALGEAVERLEAQLRRLRRTQVRRRATAGSRA
ncbi:MAG TPA: HPF/RaiA family ribosome-associated protein [Gemmatimonadaceae bacterium]|nr:HPF/RaiA family ribosome-associated protein [Gemmatimonadaceae bacterium]